MYAKISNEYIIHNKFSAVGTYNYLSSLGVEENIIMIYYVKIFTIAFVIINPTLYTLY